MIPSEYQWPVPLPAPPARKEGEIRMSDLVVITKGRYAGKCAHVRQVLDFYDPPLFYVQLQVDVRTNTPTADYVYDVPESYLQYKGYT